MSEGPPEITVSVECGMIHVTVVQNTNVGKQSAVMTMDEEEALKLAKALLDGIFRIKEGV